MSFETSNQAIEVLKDVSITIEEASTTCIIGSSGSGKTTLLQILAGLDSPDTGHIFYNDRDLLQDQKSGYAKLRASLFGYVYQFHYLLEDLTVKENCMIPLQILGKHTDTGVDEALDSTLNSLGILHLKNSYPFTLSGGERQRAAVARAIIHKPRFLLMDEPTGNLDPENAIQIHELTLKLAKDFNMGIIVATHDLDFAKKLDRTYKIESGILKKVNHE